MVRWIGTPHVQGGALSPPCTWLVQHPAAHRYRLHCPLWPYSPLQHVLWTLVQPRASAAASQRRRGQCSAAAGWLAGWQAGCKRRKFEAGVVVQTDEEKVDNAARAAAPAPGGAAGDRLKRAKLPRGRFGQLMSEAGCEGGA